jgi:transaldolase
MTLYLDSADLDEARQALGLGFIAGCTTNPTLLARAGHIQPLEAIRQLAHIFSGTVFYQVMAPHAAGMAQEAPSFLDLGPNVGLKVPATLEGFKFAAEFAARATVAITGVFSPSQALLAAEAGAQFAIPYINRLTRFVGDGAAVVAEIGAALDGTPCALLVAGIKSPAEAVAARLAGADHLSLPLEVLKAMADNPLTTSALRDFEVAWLEHVERSSASSPRSGAG